LIGAEVTVVNGAGGVAQKGALTIQCRVLYALIMRDVKSRYGGRRLGFLWALIEPVLFTSVFIFMFYLIGRTSQSGIAVPLFFVTGFCPFFMFRDLYSGTLAAANKTSPLLMFPQVTRIDLIVANTILESLVALMVISLLLGGCYALGYTFDIEQPLRLLATLAMMIGLGVGLGLVVGALTIRYEFVGTIAGVIMGRPLFLTSGLFYTADMLPPVARDYVLYNPVLHCIEAVRSSIFESFESRFFDLPFLITTMLVLIAFGLILLDRLDNQRQ